MSNNRSKTTGSIIAYKLAFGGSCDALNMSVRKLMDEGWKVHFGHHVCVNESGVLFTQSMVKYSETEPKQP